MGPTAYAAPMRRNVGVLLAVSVLVTTPLALACKPSSTPGPDTSTVIGTFAVAASLEENGCRPALSPGDTLGFSVELRRDATTLVWRRNEGPPVGGTLRSDGTFRLRTRDLREQWAADPANGIVGCTLEEINTLSGTLVESADGGAPQDAGAGDAGSGDAGSGDAGARDGGAVSRVSGFHGDHEIELAPSLGSDCSALLISNGGSFPTFPCAIVYRLEAVRSE